LQRYTDNFVPLPVPAFGVSCCSRAAVCAFHRWGDWDAASVVALSLWQGCCYSSWLNSAGCGQGTQCWDMTWHRHPAAVNYLTGSWARSRRALYCWGSLWGVEPPCCRHNTIAQLRVVLGPATANCGAICCWPAALRECKPGM